MKFVPIEPPRRFQVSGAGLSLTLSDCGRLHLAPDEQVTFVSEGGAEYDVTRKDWGFYATPSTNGRLRAFGLRTALVLSGKGRLFVMLVESGKETAFLKYVEQDRQRLLCWLDDDAAVNDLVARFAVAQAPSP
jgi:hypothetical protein